MRWRCSPSLRAKHVNLDYRGRVPVLRTSSAPTLKAMTTNQFRVDLNCTPIRIAERRPERTDVGGGLECLQQHVVIPLAVVVLGFDILTAQSFRQSIETIEEDVKPHFRHKSDFESLLFHAQFRTKLPTCALHWRMFRRET